MPEKKHRKPFEDHINSESFDVSNLGSVQERSPMDLEMEEFFNSLPDELDYSLRDSELDDRQRAISAHLSSEIAERVLRKQHGELLGEFSDSQLIELMTIPVTLAMIAEQRLHEVKPEKQEIITAPEPDLYRSELSPQPEAFADILNAWLLNLKDFVISLFRRG